MHYCVQEKGPFVQSVTILNIFSIVRWSFVHFQASFTVVTITAADGDDDGREGDHVHLVGDDVLHGHGRIGRLVTIVT